MAYSLYGQLPPREETNMARIDYLGQIAILAKKQFNYFFVPCHHGWKTDKNYLPKCRWGKEQIAYKISFI